MHKSPPPIKTPTVAVQEPTDADVLSLVRERPFVSLHDLAKHFWPLLTWDQCVRDELLLLVASDRTARPVSPAFWLRCQCHRLQRAELLRLGPMDRKHAGIGGLTYRLPGQLPPVLVQPPTQEYAEYEVSHA